VKKIKLGIAGAGAFAQSFIPLFKAHPLVGEVTLCDHDAEKLAQNTAKHGIAKTSPSFDELLATDVDAVAVMTQNWMHGPQAVRALRAGKHVYSAVPMGVSVDEIAAIVQAVEETGQIYMMGETSYYYPGAIFCREKFAKGEFGRAVYGEAEYYHDYDHGLYDVFKARGGERWREFAGSPPMHYPTHSCGMLFPVTGAHATHVSCHGYVDRHEDGLFRADVNVWKNCFSNQTALFTMSDGSCNRVNEFRRVGHTGCVRMSFFGTEACFERNNAGAAWVTKNSTARVDDLLACNDPWGGVPAEDALRPQKYYAKIHPIGRLPKEFLTLPNGHEGAHQFLVDDFVVACATGKHPPVNAWAAARYTVPGIIAHESALRDGERLAVPDFGGPKF